MENATLTALLESDREMIMANIARDRAPGAVEQALEKAVDRLTYRYCEDCGDEDLRQAAQLILQTVKRALPLIGSVGEVKRWRKDVDAGSAKRRGMSPAALGFLTIGGVLVIAVVLGLVITGRSVDALAFIKALLPAVAGLAAVFQAGRLAAGTGGKRKAAEEDMQVREEFLVDAEGLWHDLKGMMLLADSALDDVKKRASLVTARSESAGSGKLTREQAELFAGILENAYAQEGADARELIENVRFYLHGAGVEAVDYAAGNEAWFEFLPAQRRGTIRPALVENGRLVKKGMAAN